MRIAVIGPGAMGLLYGGYLSEHNDVTLVGRNEKNMADIRKDGVVIEEADGSKKVYYPNAVTDTSDLEPFDLVILFVKAGFSKEAMEQHRGIIGENTLLMTLQNGAGHESLLGKYVKEENIIIGMTKEGSYRVTPVSVCHSGKAMMAIGSVCGDVLRFSRVADVFNQCGFSCEVSKDVRAMIWDKLMINASSSVLSGIFQMPQGYIAMNASAWNIAKRLITELCAAAAVEGYSFDADEQIKRLHSHLLAAPDGYTSIYMDIKERRKTEVDVINGAVVAAAHRGGISVPTHELIVDIVHGMEERQNPAL